MEYEPNKMIGKSEFAEQVFHCTLKTLKNKMAKVKEIEAELRKLKVGKYDKLLSPNAQKIIIRYLGGNKDE